MHPRFARRLALAALCLGAIAGAAHAKEPSKSSVDDLLAKAENAADDAVKAAGLYGQAVAAGQKLKDLQAEQKAADALEAWFQKIEPPPSATPAEVTRGARPKARDLLAAVMKALDPKRSGAFVSAHALASEVLADAVALGDGAHVEDVAAVLSAHAGVPKSGVAAAALAQWAEGMATVKRGDAAKADAALEAAARAFAANGWLAQAASAATELAALRVGAKNEAKAAEALGIAAVLLTEVSDKIVIQEWMRVVKGRLFGAPPAVLDAFLKATSPFENAPSAGVAGGAGGRGRSGGGGDISDVGKLLSRLSPDKPFVTVTREKDQLLVKPVYPRKDPTKPLPLRDGQRTWEDEGGVTLFLAGPAVALAMVDLEGLKDHPGESLAPSRVRAFYLLADGESWSVSKNGTVTVSK